MIRLSQIRGTGHVGPCRRSGQFDPLRFMRLLHSSLIQMRLPDPDHIASYVHWLVQQKLGLSGETSLITTGPTQEALDPVLFITNRSNEKMGYAIGRAFGLCGAVMEHLGKHTIIVKTAAVADYYVANIPTQKLKNGGRY